MTGSGIEDSEKKLNTRSKEGRLALSKMIFRLFDLWGLDTKDQMALLGLSERSSARLMRYRKGKPLADNRDLIDRVTSLLAIHKSLRILFPRNRQLVYAWPTRPNRVFDGRSPVDVMREDGFAGLIAVKRYLEMETER